MEPDTLSYFYAPFVQNLLKTYIVEPSAEWLAELPVLQVKEATDRIKEAADMGDVTQIKSIAEELMSKSEAVAPFYDKLVRLAEDFDFDGIQKFMLELDS